MSLWQFVLPRNQITLFAGDTLGLGMPLERESQPLPHSVLGKRSGQLAAQTLVETQIIIELLLTTPGFIIHLSEE